MMDAALAASVLEARLVGSNAAFTQVCTDSRSVGPGDLFVAIKGERFDGHDFVGAAFERGAAAALVSEITADARGCLIVVPDCVAAMGRLAAHWRSRFAIPVIVVVGSNGKTTVKEMIAAILAAQFGELHVLATEGNFNNAIGLPRTLLGLRAAHRATVVELGMNHPGETAVLAAIARPTIALINNAQREHQEFMHGVAAVAQEHAAVLDGLAEGAHAVINADDPFAQLWRSRVPEGARVDDFGFADEASVHGHARADAVDTFIEMTTPAGHAHVHLRAAGRHNASNAFGAAAAGLAAGCSLTAVVRGLEAFRPVQGRLAALRGKGGVHIIDDSYNANPDSVRAALDVLAKTPSPRWLVLGDMGEVGDDGPAFHHEIGAAAKRHGIEHLYTVGTLAREATAAFGDGAVHFEDFDELTAALRVQVVAGGYVLVKGSRFMRMERAVAALVGERLGSAHG